MVIEVAVPLPLFQTFHYKITDHKNVAPGTQVKVNFRNRQLLGFVVGFPDQGHPKAKEVLEVTHQEPFFSEKMLSFFRWISSHYSMPLGEVIKGALPRATSKKAPKPRTKLSKMTAGASCSPKTLTIEQQSVLKELFDAFEQKTYAPFLLHGVTASGKTEVYLNLIRRTLESKKEAIVLVPEISLTPQLMQRFEERFPGQIAQFHSRLTPAQRYAEWLKIKKKEVSIVIGARSAIFAPFTKIGAIIIDEEHDSSFKQEERLRYNARDLSLVRGQLENAVVLLGSATPSLESYYNAQTGKLRYLRLQNRIDKKPLPKVKIIDLTNKDEDDKKRQIFSDHLLRKLAETLDQKHQAILFLNRRGYSPFLLCQSCGYSAKCPHCSVSLTVYLGSRRLMCHHCAHTIKMPSLCPDCQSTKIEALGLGTEKVEELLQSYFPSARIARMDRTSTQKRFSLEKILDDFSKQKTDILIGTQMVAKGHDFPNVTLVGVILADIAFNIPDFRAPERAFQLMTQVAGRAGRGMKAGEVVIQTYNPEHYSLLFAKTHDTLGFYKQELQFRKELEYPPYAKLIHFKISHPNEQKALDKIHWLNRVAKNIKKSLPGAAIELLGPAASPISKVKDKYRFHMLLKCPSYKEQKTFLRQLLTCEKDLFRAPTIQIDVDPLNLL